MSEQRPSPRVEKLAITNFRTFRDLTVIPFGDRGSGGDVIVTFHGDNGSGKSNAIAAMELFRALAAPGGSGAGARRTRTRPACTAGPRRDGGGGILAYSPRHRQRHKLEHPRREARGFTL